MTIGRNRPCHCGSGKKYKKCCMKADFVKRRKEAAGVYDEFGRRRRRLSDRIEHLRTLPPVREVKTDKRELPLFNPDEEDIATGWIDNFQPSLSNHDVDDCLRRIYGLIDTHPELIEDAAPDEGVIFDVSARLSRTGRYSEAAELIQRYCPREF